MSPPRRPCHQVSNLTYAAPCLRPNFIPQQRSGKGSREAGLRYEKLVAKAVPQGVHGQWFHFIDSTGPHWCQPDVLVLGQKRVLVLECKLTYTPDAVAQLRDLYVPVLRMAYPKHGLVAGIVCKNLTPEAPLRALVETLEELIEFKSPSGPLAFPVLHWLGNGALTRHTK